MVCDSVISAMHMGCEPHLEAPWDWVLAYSEVWSGIGWIGWTDTPRFGLLAWMIPPVRASYGGAGLDWTGLLEESRKRFW